MSNTADHALTWPLCQLPLRRTNNVFLFCTWPWSGEAFLILWVLKTVPDHVETILMSYLTMEAPPDHPYISSRVDYFWMFHLTMVRWGFFHILALNTVFDHVETILMSHMTMVTPPDHPYTVCFFLTETKEDGITQLNYFLLTSAINQF